jgi:hypothetical protein
MPKLSLYETLYKWGEIMRNNFFGKLWAAMNSPKMKTSRFPNGLIPEPTNTVFVWDISDNFDVCPKFGLN